MDDNAFKQLDELNVRKECPSCRRTRLYFCYDCHIYTPGVSSLVPAVKLPYQIDIIKHSREVNGKSTAIHCALLASDQTRLFDYKDLDIPVYREEQINTVLVYPDDKATSIEEFVKSNGPIQRLLFLDGTWKNMNKVRRLSNVQNVPKVSLNAYKTDYWRPQRGYPDECLATIEAIFYAVKEAWQAENPGVEYNGEFDQLLFWFKYFKSRFIDSSDK